MVKKNKSLSMEEVENNNQKNNQQFYKELISILKEKKLVKEDLHKLKIKLSKKYDLGKIPTDIDVLLNTNYEDRNLLVTKPVRTISGVAVIALMTAPHKCPHGKCVFCPGGPNSYYGDVPQSYTGKEPSTMRAIRNNYDPYLITMNRLEQYICSGHIPEKAEIIIQGGTFPAMSKEYQDYFVKHIFKAMNDFSDLFYDKERSKKRSESKFNFKKFKEFFELPGDIYDKKRVASIKEKLLKLKEDGLKKEKSNNLKKEKSRQYQCTIEQEQLKNETSKIRCVGLTIETKPDWGFLEHGNEMLRQGATRIELGIQTTKNDVLKVTNRGHTIKDTINSIRILKDLAFKLNFHMMPGLPKTTRDEDLEILKEIFDNPDYRPDMLKIYPCMVMHGTPLEIQFNKGQFIPINTAQAAEIISEFKRFIPKYCRIQRIQRDIPTVQTTAGVDKTNLRQYVEELVNKKGIECKCIRCQEAGRKGIGKSHDINVLEYESSGGMEYFVSADSDVNSLLGFCRLRFPSQSLRSEITEKTALIRELHVFGNAASIGKKGQENEVQHKGVGKKLMQKAEQIAIDHCKNKICVISAVGTREYYKKIGYKRDGVYMSKKL